MFALRYYNESRGRNLFYYSKAFTTLRPKKFLLETSCDYFSENNNRDCNDWKSLTIMTRWVLWRHLGDVSEESSRTCDDKVMRSPSICILG